MNSSLSTLETPALLLDRRRLHANIERMREAAVRQAVTFRPHVKTAKCIEVARAVDGGTCGPITVSTLLEADQFADHGYRDITYAVGITPNKWRHVARLLGRGVSLNLLLDSVEAARAVVDAASAWPSQVGVFIEIDSDGHRAGVKPEGTDLLAIATALRSPQVLLRGVLTHAGASYECAGEDEIRAMAELERDAAVHAAGRLRAAGFVAPVVSVGSTPTALFARDPHGVTELRAGVFVFFDLVMAGIGVCRTTDIALSVLTTVVGHQRDKGWTLVDAGWMALSRDRGTQKQAVDQGYGLVCDQTGTELHDYIVVAANQEHGVIAHRSGAPARLLDVAVGTQLRILPNHACATAAQHASYHVLGADGSIAAQWSRFTGW